MFRILNIHYKYTICQSTRETLILSFAPIINVSFLINRIVLQLTKTEPNNIQNKLLVHLCVQLIIIILQIILILVCICISVRQLIKILNIF